MTQFKDSTPQFKKKNKTKKKTNKQKQKQKQKQKKTVIHQLQMGYDHLIALSLELPEFLEKADDFQKTKCLQKYTELSANQNGYFWVTECCRRLGCKVGLSLGRGRGRGKLDLVFSLLLNKL